ncbi:MULTISPECIES: hypothetical protein [unclassified Kaistella]|uniref:hypothetical protein n=1 Tax=unclassified Kaistella TaxID=2762626 RepID=UPI0027364198|nr:MULTISPECIES: hypothetical protein [unclassified Kaistella]MDP2452651.1 hypothetical protein [Kaistella sp. SH11-4b]MDP2455560.1 hypothetical protein [Kaistella sp. SH40-3]MDP2458464.1 hypothetical protein [Kaistella sp. SH19-2b]
MVEFRNKNLSKSEPNYFYQVDEFVTTFGKDANKTDSFEHVEVFRDNDLYRARVKALDYYNERLKGIENTSYVLPFASPCEFRAAENSAFSITVSLVEYYNEDELYQFAIEGEDEETTVENKEIERIVYESKGYDIKF